MPTPEYLTVNDLPRIEQVGVLVHQSLILRKSFKRFVAFFWPLVSDYPYIGGWHLDTLCDHLQAVYDGTLLNLLVNLPPRHSKSVVCSVLFPVWWMLNDPVAKILHASHSNTLTEEHASLSRRLIQSPQFQKTFPGVLVLDGDTNAKAFYKVAAGGQRLSLSVGSKSAGWDSTLTILDDLHDIKQRESEAERKHAREFFKAIGTRKVPGVRVPRLVIGQRVHQDDVSAYVMDTYRDDPDWSYLILPAEYQGPQEPALHNGLNFTDPRTENGELLWPDGVTQKDLADRRTELCAAYQIIFNQNPYAAEGDYFRKDTFRYFKDDGLAYDLDGQRYDKSQTWCIFTADCAGSKARTADYTVIAVVQVLGQHLILVDLSRKRLDGVQIVPEFERLNALHQPSRILIEQEFTGRVYIDQLLARGLPVVGFSARKATQVMSVVDSAKEVRAVHLQTKMELGQVWFPQSKPWVTDVEAELLAFPGGRHDDIVDALSMAAIHTRRYRYEAQPIRSPEDQQTEWDRKQREHRERMLTLGT